jgi:excisionase family DNA binding protein
MERIIPEVFTVKEVAEMLKFSVAGVYQLINDGQIKALRLGVRNYRITADELKRILRENQV